MSNKQRGMTLVELVVAIVILGIGVVALMSAYATLIRGSAGPVIQKQMLAIAEEMIEEISHKPFAAQSNDAAAACARDTWNDLQDYATYDTTKSGCVSTNASVSPQIYDITGSPITTLAGYGVAVSLSPDDLPPAPQPNPVTGGDCVRITVTVTHGSDSLTLSSWRTHYGQ